MKNLKEILLEKLKIDKDTNADGGYKERRDDPKLWKVGDILVTSGGYNMILVDFYKIIKATGKSFVVRELKQKIVSGNGMQGECIAIENEFEPRAKDITCRINKYNSVKIDDHYAHLWGGNPEHYDHMD